MKSSITLRVAVGSALATLAGAALAQDWTPASELVGQPIRVTTVGVTNTLYLDPGGALRIFTPKGNMASGTWTAANGQLCLLVGGQRECVPYPRPFQAGTPNVLTSSCGATETWLVPTVNSAPASGSPSTGKR
jgi:hypothetical protein